MTRRPASIAEVIEVLDDLPVMLRTARRMRGLSLRAVADECGISFNALSRHERGRDLTLANARALLVWLSAPTTARQEVAS